MSSQATTATCGWDFEFSGKCEGAGRTEVENEYASLIQHQIRPFFQKFADALESQTPDQREQGRCAVIEFERSEKQRISSFTTADGLRTYLASDSRSSTSSSLPTRRRRLFILEDLPYNHILALGARLRIPPSFFAGHFDDPAALAFNHRNTFEKCSLPNFRLGYATSTRVEVDAPPSPTSDKIYAFDTRVSRHLVTYSKQGPVYDEAKSHHALSFWSSIAQEDGSWDAILLADPPLGSSVRCMVTGKMYPLQYDVPESLIPTRHFFPELDTPRELPRYAAQWATTYAGPAYASIFDDTLQSFYRPTKPILATQDPLSVVEYPRRIVIATNVAYLRRRYANLVKLQNSTHFYPQAMRHNYLASFSKSSCSSWSTEFFDFIVGSRAAMRVWTREMDDNMTALGLDDPHSSAPQWEKDGWRCIKELGAVVEETVGAFANGYLQYVTIQEARVSNRNAHSLSRITVLTMLFIPLSTVASIFSMGGDFLPGETRAWVFWVVALPVLATLAYLYWYRTIADICKRRARQLLPLYEEKLSEQ